MKSVYKIDVSSFYLANILISKDISWYDNGSHYLFYGCIVILDRLFYMLTVCVGFWFLLVLIKFLLNSHNSNTNNINKMDDEQQALEALIT